jgi:capsular exopolysaccharide synthesis family protein
MRAAARRGAKTLLVSCPSIEAKTVVAANLAVALAQAGSRVTFVCADVRDDYAARLLGAHDRSAAPRPLTSRSDMAQVLRDTPIEGLRVLPAGALDNDHGTIPQTPVLRWALGRLRSGADFVIIDSPPVLMGADADAMAELVEMVLVVGDARESTRRQVDAAAQRLEHVRADIIGCVLDNVGRRVRMPVMRMPLRPRVNGAALPARAGGVLANVESVVPVGVGEHR